MAMFKHVSPDVISLTSIYVKNNDEFRLPPLNLIIITTTIIHRIVTIMVKLRVILDLLMLDALRSLGVNGLLKKAIGWPF